MTPQARSYTPPTLDVTNMAGNGSQISVSVLVNADMQSESQQEPVKTTASNLKLEDLFDGIKASLLKVIEWAKRLPAFGSLSLDDQVKLLKSSWCEHCVLKIAARNGPKSDTILLSNGVACNKDNVEDPEVRRVLQRVFSELAYWLDYLNVDRVELACLKGILLFNPGEYMCVAVIMFVEECGNVGPQKPSRVPVIACMCEYVCVSESTTSILLGI